MNFTTNAVPVLKMQSYKAYNRSDMFVPNRGIASPLMAAAIATPYVGHRPVHAVPIVYGNVKTRMIGSRGMATPINGGIK